MNRSGPGRQEEREREESGDFWKWLAVGAGAAAAVAGGVYMLSRALESEPEEPRSQGWVMTHDPTADDLFSSDEESLQPQGPMDELTDAVSRLAVSSVPRVSNLNSLLADIHSRYVAIRKEDLERHYNVFMKVIYPLHENMKKVDPYYGRYSSRIQIAGSHYDRLRIKKPDEFDMDIVIGLPVNLEEHPSNPEESDIVIEPVHAGYVQLRAGVQYVNILIRDGADSVINAQAYKWLDDKKYIQRSKFMSWFKSVVDRALNKFLKYNGYPSVTIDGVPYTISVSSSGPAYTLIIKNYTGFKLDVDLVPALKFPERRWLGKNKAYRDIPPHCSAAYWMVVPKPIKHGNSSHDEDRSWRIAMHDQERKFIHNSYNLRSVNRLLKKLRDAQDMDYIASYYIKTLFLWKIDELNNPAFWQRDLATIFKVMLKEFHTALVEKKIRYFWNRRNNLLKIPDNILKGYVNKLEKLINKMDEDYMWVARYLLTPTEYSEYEQILP
ncbi:cyclic GMP-AMP synthase-like receptor isoform X2 [Epargyreus clarus]